MEAPRKRLAGCFGAPLPAAGAEGKSAGAWTESEVLAQMPARAQDTSLPLSRAWFPIWKIRSQAGSGAVST